MVADFTVRRPKFKVWIHEEFFNHGWTQMDTDEAPIVGSGSCCVLTKRNSALGPWTAFACMKIYGILGILWLASSCCSAYHEIDMMLEILPAHLGPKIFYRIGSLLLLNLALIVASLFLVRGDLWARWLIGIVAALEMFGGSFLMVHSHSFPIIFVIHIVFALVTAVLLLKPRGAEANTGESE